MKVIFALLKRELLEHRNIWFVPLILIALAILVRLSLVFGSLSIDIELPPQLQLNNAVNNVVDGVIARGLNSMNYIIMMTMMVVACFYALSCLYNERQDDSVLFWRSLPISDTTTIASKLLIALVVAPVSIVVCQTIVAFVFFGFNAFDYLSIYFTGSLLLLLKISIWSLLPTVAWCLFCSEIAQKNPFLLAFVAPVLLWVVDALFLGVVNDIVMVNRWVGFNNYTSGPLVSGLVLSAIFVSLAIIKRSQRI